jgi:hypothetical protein
LNGTAGAGADIIEPVLDQRTAEGDRVNDERGPGAMPKLYGAPAYARPLAAPVAPVDRPFDPDDLPVESKRSPEDLERAQQLQPRSYEEVATTEPLPTANGASTKLHGRLFRLRIPGRNTNGR